MLFPNIEAERARHAMTKAELAQELGINRQTYLNWQKGTTDISASKLAQLATLWDCSIDYLIGRATLPK